MQIWKRAVVFFIDILFGFASVLLWLVWACSIVAAPIAIGPRRALRGLALWC